MPKKYDRAYFDRWYRNESTRVHGRGELRRKVFMAVTVAEYFLHRPLRSVLDIGCGEGAWLPHLRAIRPGVAYTGIDSSEYVVERFGRSRNIRLGSFGELPSMRLGAYDLVVCSDVLHYVPDEEIGPGIRTIATACEGAAYVEVLTREDTIEGDLQSLIRRPASTYRDLFRRVGMTRVAPYIWLSRSLRNAPAELES